MVLEVPVWLEANVGDTAISISARQARTIPDALVSTPGVANPTDLLVVQRAAGANFSVDVGAGMAVILGTSVSNQGKYVVRSTATLNLAIAAAPGSSTRTDLVYAQVRDKQADGGSAYDWVIDKVTGTLGAGLPATPANAIALASIGPIVPATPSITTALITSLRPPMVLAGASTRVGDRHASDSASLTATAGEAQDTGVGVVTFIAVAGRRYRLRYVARAEAISATATCDFRIRDGGASAPTTASTLLSGASSGTMAIGGADNRQLAIDEIISGLSAGIHKIGAFFASTAGGTVRAGQSTGQSRQLSVYDEGTL